MAMAELPFKDQPEIDDPETALIDISKEENQTHEKGKANEMNID